MIELIYCALITTVAAGSGLTLLRRIGPVFHSRAELLVFALGLGFGLVALTVLALGFLQLLYEWVFYLLLVLGVAVGRKELIGLAGELQGSLGGLRLNWRSYHFWIVALVGLGLFFNLTRALQPAHGPTDPLAYHLALPKFYLAKHYLSFERTLTGTLYPDNMGMLYTLAIGLRNAELAQMMHYLMGVFSLLAVWAFSRKFFGGKVGVWAVAILSFTPAFFFFTALGYVGVGLAFFQILGFWALFNWIEEGDRRSLLLAAIFTGLAMGTKHTGCFMAVIGVAVVIGTGYFKRRAPLVVAKQVLLLGGVTLVLVLPWYARAFWEAGNPLWPVANQLFGGLSYNSTFNVGIVSGAQDAPTPIVDRFKDLGYWAAMSLWEWAWNEEFSWQHKTGIYFVALLPGLLVFVRSRRACLLALFGLGYYLLTVLYIDGNPRYNLALFAFLSVLAGYVVERLVQSQDKLLRQVAKFGFVASIICQLGLAYALAYDAIGFAFSRKAPEPFLVEREGNYRAMRFVNQQLPDSAFVLLQGIVRGYYCDRPYMWDHPYQTLLQYGDYQTADQLLERMGDLGITHIVRMIYIPPGRERGGYPQYFADALHEDFRKKHLKLLYRDQQYVVFEVVYPA